MSGRRGFEPDQREAILRRDSYICAYCGQPAIEVDHVVPRTIGGPSTRGNGVATCGSCNHKKAGKLNEEFLRRGFFVLLSAGESLRWLDDFGRGMPRKMPQDEAERPLTWRDRVRATEDFLGIVCGPEVPYRRF